MALLTGHTGRTQLADHRELTSSIRDRRLPNQTTGGPHESIDMYAAPFYPVQTTRISDPRRATSCKARLLGVDGWGVRLSFSHYNN
jgi:hypothetical protein